MTDFVIPIVIIIVAIAVAWYGFQQLGRSTELRPRGRRQPSRRSRHIDPDVQRHRQRLEAQPATPIAQAQAGYVKIAGRLASAPQTLGGPNGRVCVWRNRAGASAEHAVAAEIVFIADATGQVALENLERATVTAPTEKTSQHREWVSLYLDDHVNVIGHFDPEPSSTKSHHAGLVYGTLGALGPLDVQLVERRAIEESS